MNRIVVLISFFICGFFICCSDNEEGTFPDGIFQYTAFDSTGVPVVQGWFTLEIQDSAHIGGECHFTKVHDPQNIGPQTGDGQLVGEYDQDILSVNLHPQIVDNNVFLRGVLEGGMFSGDWYWEGFPGVLNQGTFQGIVR